MIQVGGNSKAKTFFKSQPDFREGMSIQEKYNSRAAALYRDKVCNDNYYQTFIDIFMIIWN